MIGFLASCEHDFPKQWQDFAVEFDRVARKPLITFYREHLFKEMELYQDPDTGMCIRSAKTSRCVVRNPTQRKLIIEVSRTYPNGDVVPNFSEIIPGEEYSIEPFSGSETIRLGETPLETLMRLLTEEMAIVPGRITPANLEMFGRDIPHFENRHKSSVYPTVQTENETTWFNVVTHQLSSSFKSQNTRDSGVTLNREWFDEL
jgi:hypothetical protein